MGRNYELYFNVSIYEKGVDGILHKLNGERLVEYFNIYKECLKNEGEDLDDDLVYENSFDLNSSVCDKNYTKYDYIVDISNTISKEHPELIIKLYVQDEGNIDNESCIIYFHNGLLQIEEVKQTYGEFDRSKLSKFEEYF